MWIGILEDFWTHVPQDIKDRFKKPSFSALQRHYNSLLAQDEVSVGANDEATTVARRKEYLSQIKEVVCSQFICYMLIELVPDSILRKGPTRKKLQPRKRSETASSL